MWKKDKNILLFILFLLLLVLLFAWGAGKLRWSAVRRGGLWKTQAAASWTGLQKEKRDGAAGEGKEKLPGDAGAEPAKEPKKAAESKGKIALTFDDGPHPTCTLQLLEGLAKRGVKASFFITGQNAESYPDLVLKMYEQGHLIGNHTYSHLQLGKHNREAFKEELIQTNEIIKEITGEEVVYVRPPYGSWDKSFEEELNMFPVLWTIDPLDWCSDDVSCVVNKVLPKVKENSIILMHDEYPSTVTAALRIVDELLGQGYEFVTVDELLFD